MQRSPILIFHPRSIHQVTGRPDEAACHVVDEVIGGHGEVGIVCVSGARDRDKCILLNYLIRYLHWLSCPEDGDSSQPVFVTETGLREEGVFLWPQAFVVEMGRESGSSSDRVPLLLVDVSGNEETSNDIHVHVIKGKITSSGSLMDEMRVLTGECDQQAAANTDSPPQRNVHLIRDWQSIHKSDWRTIVTRSRSRECFSAPDTGGDIVTVSEYLTSLVYHIFGEVCGSEEQLSLLLKTRTVHEVSGHQEEECVVEKAVQQYITGFREKVKQLSDLTTTGAQSLLSVHNTLLHQAIDQVRSIQCPAAVKLQRINKLNQQLRDELERLKGDYQDASEKRKDGLISLLQAKYSNAMERVLEKKKVVDQKELVKLHKKEMRKCLTEFRSKVGSGELQMQEKIEQTFLMLESRNAAVYFQICSSLIEDHVRTFSDQMDQLLSQRPDTDVVMKSPVLKINALKNNARRSFEAALIESGIPPAIGKRMTKDYDSAIEQLKASLTSNREQFQAEKADKDEKLSCTKIKSFD